MQPDSFWLCSLVWFRSDSDSDSDSEWWSSDQVIATVSRTEQCTVGSRLGTYIYIRLQGVAMAAPVPTSYEE